MQIGKRTGNAEGYDPGDHSSLHAPGAQGLATPVAESGGGQVGALADGARPATEKGAIPGGLITTWVRNGLQVLTPEPLGNGQCDRLVSGVKPELGSLRQSPVIHQLREHTWERKPATNDPRL